jgi:hypothetical protein
MTCRHSKGDPACGSTVGGQQWQDNQRYYGEAGQKALREFEAREQRKAQGNSPKPDEYEVMETERVGEHLVVKARYPSCAKCSYEGVKVLVLLNVTEAAALRWRRMDPHFGDKPRGPSETPSPAARFPASAEGWEDALTYARFKAGVN